MPKIKLTSVSSPFGGVRWKIIKLISQEDYERMGIEELAGYEVPV